MEHARNPFFLSPISEKVPGDEMHIGQQSDQIAGTFRPEQK
jgi:hypothetical protein